jgi:hypothetical protein
MPLILNGATSGSTTIQATDAVTQTITLPNNTGTVLTTASSGVVTQAMLSTNVAGNGPAFNAYATATQSITTGTLTKIILSNKRFDTNSNFDSTTNYRFTPTVAGYYAISGAIAINAPSANTGAYAIIYKNGTGYAVAGGSGNTAMYPFPSVSSIVYCNGSTDYVELYGYISSATASTVATIFVSGDNVYFNGFLARSA